MRVYIPNMENFFNFMDTEGYKYVVLRNHFDFKSKYPHKGSKEDIDLLVSSDSIDAIYNKYKLIPKQFGVKCDIYSDTDNPLTNYLNHPYLPHELAQKTLDNRIKWNDKFYIPSDEEYLYTLMYHIVYQKHDTSGYGYYHTDNVEKIKYHKYISKLSTLLSVKIPTTLYEMHELLKIKNYAIEEEILFDYIVHDYNRIKNKVDLRSYCYMYLQNELPGEMNLYVIRATAVQTKKVDEIINLLKQKYQIIMVKKINFITRVSKRKGMRGGKWRWGGFPHVAIVVFDHHPNETTIDERKTHPMVLNSTQFYKTNIREWYKENTNVYYKKNPLHSTDNESEAIGHLSLYFNKNEIKQIINDLTSLREGMH